MNILPVLLNDAYKTFHVQMYPENMTLLFSNMTPRSYKRMGCEKSVFFGLQYYIKEYLIKQWDELFFERPLDEVLNEYRRFHKHFSFCDIETWHIEKLHKLGYLPIKIQALPEGSLVNARVPYYVIYNTHSDHAWLVNFLETQMSTVMWDLCTIATIGRQYRTILDKYAIETTGTKEFVKWQGHDFSMRGRSSIESCLNQAGWLLSFTGTDTLPAVMMLEKYYNANIENELVGSSVPASEHSVMTSYGKENEIDAFVRLLNQFPTGILSVVSDSFDLWKVCTEYLPTLKDKIMDRDGKLVIRPDCYSDDTLILTPDGWMEFKELDENSLVAQVNSDDSYEFVKPIKIVNEPYTGLMYHYHDFHGKMDLLVTPTHRMLYKKFDSWKEELAHDLKPNNYEKSFIRSANARDKGRKLSFIERLKIAFQADGSYVTGTSSSIRFSFSKIRKIKRLEDLLIENNILYEIYKLSDGRVEFNIKIDSINVSKDFHWVDLSNLCSNWCKEFIEELSHWDSHIRNEGRIKFDTTTKSVIDVVEIISISAGYGCLISKYEDDRKDIFSDVYTANILFNNKISGQSIETDILKYDGNIVCVSVPTGKILVKRNKCTMICGNSGDPINIVCGKPVYENMDEDDAYYWKDKNSTEKKGVIELLWDVFGGTINEQGYKVLDSHIGCIYGDSITIERATQICERLKAKGFASTNIVLGVGSYTMNYNTRDNLGIAVKSTYCEITTDLGQFAGGLVKQAREIFKDPITDDGTKKSAKGLLAVYKNTVTGDFELVDQVSWNEVNNCELKTVFKDGKLIVDQSLSEIRERLNKYDYSR